MPCFTTSFPNSFIKLSQKNFFLGSLLPHSGRHVCPNIQQYELFQLEGFSFTTPAMLLYRRRRVGFGLNESSQEIVWDTQFGRAANSLIEWYHDHSNWSRHQLLVDMVNVKEGNVAYHEANVGAFFTFVRNCNRSAFIDVRTRIE